MLFRSISDLVKEWGREILGDDHSMRFMKGFPLLVKFLGMNDRMSLQVHPSDEFAQRYEMEGTGKMEATAKGVLEDDGFSACA